MNWVGTLLWISIAIIFYAFLGYGLILYLLVLIKRKVQKSDNAAPSFFEPPVTLVIPCFNEADIMETKIANCRELDYPCEKLSLIFITDGSTDHFADVLRKHPDIQLLHDKRRAGKTAAGNRAITFVKTQIVVFSDANTFLNKEALRNIVKHFADEKVGCVSGEKRIMTEKSDSASAAGEGIYWKYESLLKKLDSELYSAVGAAGELVAFRTSLYKDLPEDTLLDDFMQSMQIAAAGFKIVYEPEAYAAETASANVKEELKRKIRISAGAWQSMKRLTGVLRFNKTPLLFFQYISHRVLRWTVTPFLLILVFLLNGYLAFFDSAILYSLLFAAQLFFYGGAIMGYILENRKIRIKPFFVPYYFCVMNYAALAGLIRFLSGEQKGAWEKAQRKVI